MPRRLRRRFTTPSKKKQSTPAATPGKYEVVEKDQNQETTPRGRLQGALKVALEPGGDDSDSFADQSHSLKRAYTRRRKTSLSSDDGWSNRRPSPQRYVLKLFDRSVDLSQFDEDSSLYPICRAWIVNKPKMNYKKIGKNKYKPPEPTEESVELPGPIGPPITRIPKLLPEQEQRSKDNINLDYDEAPPPPHEVLLAGHFSRWAAVRRRWADQACRAEERYHATQQLLNKININAI